MRHAILAVVACGLLPATAAQSPVVFTPFATGLSAPVDLQAVPDDPTRFYVVEQAGRVRVLEGGAVRTAPVLDITARVASPGELGLLGLAFDPGWPARPYVYVHYTREHAAVPAPALYQTVIARFAVDPATSVADPASEAALLVLDQPAPYHNAGALAFGPDGHLYVTLGDGTDPANGQNTATLPGSILRLDVGGTGGPLDCGLGTGIATVPASNPLADGPGGACDEIHAYGFRNPWRLSFDAVTGRLWAGDVGNDAWEEVDTVAAGGNYGWSVLEGTHCFLPPSGCAAPDALPPVWEYDHATGRSVTGGYVYRGSRVPGLAGAYVYADFSFGTVWALRLHGTAPPSATVLGDLGPASVTSFGIDAAGEVYAVTYDGTIYRLDPDPSTTGGGPDPAALALEVAGPNPARGRTALRMTAGLAGPARLALIDPLGREVVLLFHGFLEAATPTEVAVDLAAFSPGVYVAHLTARAGGRSVHVVVVR